MNDIFEYDFFDDAIEDVDMYDDDYDDAYEDVDMFDENYFEAMEGPAREYRRENNKGKTRDQIVAERDSARDGSNYAIRATKNRDLRDALLAANKGGSKLRKISEDRARSAYTRLLQNNIDAANSRNYEDLGKLKDIHYKDVSYEMNHPSRSSSPKRPRRRSR